MKPESNNIDDYLKFDSVVDWYNPAIKEKAEDIIQNAMDETNKARLIYEWVRDEIPHSNDIDSEISTCTAIDVLSY